MEIVLSALLLLLLGDFVATFLYHVPEHVFGKYHSIVHHSPNRSFVRYAWLNRKPVALIFGFLSFSAYLVWVPLLWLISAKGTLLGLCLAELHVIWRHQFSDSYQTPPRVRQVCQLLCITTPERHWRHHQNANLAYGDIFTFYETPAQYWLKLLRRFKKSYAVRL
ncbi:sterol desaturase family protein [Almyronema epifaneia]|uniref:Sterol desaturase family protein n=1 Tax=Almyronema epifaneia S1 TaxID=2991925 RepID=A0ABW6I9F6_9CYAN